MPADLRTPLVVTVGAGNDVERVRLGWFALPGADAGTDPIPSLAVRTDVLGRVILRSPPEDDVAPTTRSPDVADERTLPWPDESGPYLAVAWWDADDDGLLDLGDPLEVEPARALERSEAGDLFFLTAVTWRRELDHAEGEAESAVGGRLPLNASRAEGWRVTVPAAREAPFVDEE